MKTNSIIALILSISLFGLFGCADKYEVDYEAPVKIEFTGVDHRSSDIGGLTAKRSKTKA